MPFNHINCVVLMHYASSLSHATHNNDSCSLDPFSERTKQTFYDLYVICTEVCACTVYTVDCMLRFWSNGDTSSFGSEISKTIYFERPNQHMPLQSVIHHTTILCIARAPCTSINIIHFSVLHRMENFSPLFYPFIYYIKMYYYNYHQHRGT